MKKIKKNGFITLILVLVVSAIGLAIGTTIISNGLTASQNSLEYLQYYQSNSMAEACVEYALKRIRENPANSDSGIINASFGSCSYTIDVLSGESRLINANATVGTVVQKIQVSIDTIRPKIHIVSWKK